MLIVVVGPNKTKAPDAAPAAPHLGATRKIKAYLVQESAPLHTVQGDSLSPPASH